MSANQVRTFSLRAVVAPLLVLCCSTALVWAGPITAGKTPKIIVSSQGSTSGWSYTPGQDAWVPKETGNVGDYRLNTVKESKGVLGGTTDIKVDQFEFNPDPFVLNNVLVTNTTATTQIYSVTVGLPTSFGAPNLISGTVTTSVIDGGGGGATISTVPTPLPNGTPIYQAQIDGVTVQTLQNNPFSVVVPGSGAASASFGPIANATPVTANIGIVLTFQLTAGDTAAILSRFDVVPEPSTLLLAGLVVVLAANFRRR